MSKAALFACTDCGAVKKGDAQEEAFTAGCECNQNAQHVFNRFELASSSAAPARSKAAAPAKKNARRR